MPRITANVVFVPERTGDLYPIFGVDFLHDRDLADVGETQGAADHVAWVEADDPTVSGRVVEDGEVIDPGTWELSEADEIIAAQGYRRTASWEETSAGYLVAHIEPVDDAQ